MKNQQINLDEINSLDEAKRQIAILLDSEQSIYYFIYLLCNYEIRASLLKVKGYAELIQQEKFIDENPFFLKSVLHAEHKIHKLIDVISRTAIVEKTGGIKYFQELKEKYYQPVATDLKSLLAKSVSEIEKFIDYQNELLYRSIKFAKENGQTISKKSPVQFQSNMLEDLPIIQFETEILEEVISDVIFFITQDEPFILNLSLTTEFDEHVIRIIFGCLTSSSITDKLLADFSQFESVPTIFNIESPSILLYRSWCWLKAYNGDLLLDIQNQTENVALVSVTICLQR